MVEVVVAAAVVVPGPAPPQESQVALEALFLQDLMGTTLDMYVWVDIITILVHRARGSMSEAF